MADSSCGGIAAAVRCAVHHAKGNTAGHSILYRWVAAFTGTAAAGSTYRTKLEEERKKKLGTLIESETEAYILDKAARMGLTVRIKVGTEENSEGVPVPVSAELTGTPSRELSCWIEAELGIPVERQVWLDEN